MHRYANSTGLVSYSAGDRLTNPPRCVGAKLESLIWIEFFDGTQQASIAFLDKVQKVQTAATIALSNTDDKTHVGLSHFVLGDLAILGEGSEFLSTSFFSFREWH